MGDFMNFAQILEGKIRKEVESSLVSEGIAARNVDNSSAENFGGRREIDTDPAHLAYLMSQLPAAKTAFSPLKSTYPKPAPKARPPHFLTESQSLAYQFFMHWGGTLSPSFNAKELKQQFWSLAKRLHPDCPQGSGPRFIELKAAYKDLQQALKK